MNAIHEGVTTLAELELRSANNKFPLFNSKHEAYAIIKEEFDEAFDELVDARGHISELWRRTKANESTDKAIALLHNDAILLAEEAIQLAAMCLKYEISLNPEERKRYYEQQNLGFNPEPKHS